MTRKVVEYLDAAGRSPFGGWFMRIEAAAAARIRRSIARMEGGNFGDSKSVGKGVSECRVDYGAGYRVYFGREGDELVILLGGGTKKRQQQDIEAAQQAWTDYRARKKER